MRYCIIVQVSLENPAFPFCGNPLSGYDPRERGFCMCAKWIRSHIKNWNPRLFGGLPFEFLLGVVIAIILGIRPMTWGFKLFLLLLLMAIVGELASRLPLTVSKKVIAALLGAIATAAVGYGPIEDQYHIDAVLRDYKSTRDLVDKYQVHDESLKNVVNQYDRLRKANSFFESWYGQTFADQQPAINARNIEDLKTILNDFQAAATPLGDGLQIRLGLNMYRIIFSVPMRITPNIYFGPMVEGTTAQIIESSNLGFTVLFLPLSRPVNVFGRPIKGT
ncbi:MAG TPA: hypothetical protein VMR17_12575 [Xanthobacteraceae bacterium]|nr:hypothetical protein [Xanthobacteraceae bacterium]